MNVQVCLQTTQSALDADWSATPSQQIELKNVQPLDKLPAGSGKANFVEPVTAVLTLAAATLGFRMFEFFKKKKERGLQIDLRTKPATVTDLANVPNGFLVIIQKDGTPKIEKASYDKPEQLADVMAKLLGGG